MMKSRFSGLISFLFLFFLQTGKAQNNDARMVGQCIKALTDVMVHDITSPPVASRDYVYPIIAFYEASRPGDSLYRSFAGQLNDLQELPKPSPGLEYDWLIAGTTAFYKTGYAFVFSKDLFQKSWDSIEFKLHKRAVSTEVNARSVQFGEQVAAHILKWARGDNYIHTRTLPRFTPANKPGLWQPTGPDFMEAIEPYWNKIRPMTLTRADQFMLPAPVLFNSQKFIDENKEVYEISKKLTDEQRAQANFWDCNPFATQTVGHLMYSVKKISPGGHWMGITAIAIDQQKQNLTEALYTYSLVSIAIFDVIIAAWDEKYRSNYIRPITAIQQSIAPEWQPVLQTPPFPEYISGHSVISMASATVLTHIFGDHFHYVDNVEKSFGLPNRSFNSFIDAANEAAISRLYGGIHFRQAIENGKDMGRNVGNHVLDKIRIKVDGN
jgi:hypothetical protein